MKYKWDVNIFQWNTTNIMLSGFDIIYFAIRNVKNTSISTETKRRSETGILTL